VVKLIKKHDPRETDHLELGKDPYLDRLYGCFRFDNPRADEFVGERKVEIVFRSGRKVKVTVPEALKINLPAGKAVNQDFFVMEPIGDNLDSMMLLSMRVGWNQVEKDLARIVGLDPQGNFVARFATPEYDIPVSTASVAPLGKRNTWIGMILVHPEVRRQGIANAMMQHCVNYAISQGRIINGLDATPMGNTVYGAVGYVDSYRIWRCFFSPAEFRSQPCDRKRIFRVEEKDLADLIKYDTARFMERENVIRSLFADSEGEAYLYRDDNGDIGGFVFARPGRIRYFIGPFTADSKGIAASLLGCVCKSLDAKGVDEAFIDTPESKFSNPGSYDKTVFDQINKPSGHSLIHECAPVRDFTRMYQAVDERKARELIEKFIKVEGLERSNRRVQEFSETMNRSIDNYTETMGFKDYEAQVLQHYYWGITGPEKG
jgi:GNAT superfamily N-acetyltransferase